MIVGHNFDTEVGFRRSIVRGHEDPGIPTWRNLLAYFLPEAKLSPQNCFFTNFYLGAIIHPRAAPGQMQKTTNTGAFKCSPAYRAACTKAIRTQVEIVRPSVIALLGSVVPKRFEEAFQVFRSSPL